MDADPNLTSSDQQPEHQQIIVRSGETLDVSIQMEAGSKVHLQVVKDGANGPRRRSLHFSSPQKRTPKNKLELNLQAVGNFFTAHWQIVLIALALAIYLATRFIALDSFPIYFFTDEAIQTNRAAELVQNHWYGEGHELLPTFFINGGQYNLGVSVYVQVLPYLLFGKSIWVTRGVSVLLSLLAALAVGLMMRKHFHSKQAYLAILLLSITPAWFLHSRTAFETVLAVSFYAAFVYCYLMYRSDQVNYIFPAAAFAALAFYSYSPAQMVLAVTLVGLLLMDLRYHWKHRKQMLMALGLGLIFMVPYFRYLNLHPDENFRHLQILDSYWAQPIPPQQKLGIYFSQYFASLNPIYWFSPESSEIVRHLMRGYGHLLWWSFPLLGLGLVLTLTRLKQAAYRTLLLVLIAAPSGAALVSPSITRALFMVIPATLLGAIAIDQLIEWLGKIRLRASIAALAVFMLLGGINVYMLSDALHNGPTWYQDYGLYGMQYGAKQVFAEIKDYLAENPEDKLLITSSWANGADNVARFFFADPMPFGFAGIDQWMTQYKELNDKMVFVITPEEMEKISSSPKFTNIRALRTIAYPTGKTGFYFIKLSYVDNIQQILADEVAARRKLYDGTVTLQDGTTAAVKYSLLDMGVIQDAFDGNDETVIRTAESNPLVVSLKFTEPYSASRVTLHIGGAPTIATLEAVVAGDSTPIQMTLTLPPAIENRDITFDLGSTVALQELTITIKNKDDGEPDHVHLWEVNLQ